MIRFPCGTCGRRLRVPARLAGKRGRCERCGAINRVPLADVALPEGEHVHEEHAHEEHERQASGETGRAEAAAAEPSPPHPEKVREAPAPPPPKAEAGKSFSTETVPAAESAAVEVRPPAFGIDEASVFPPVAEFDRAPEIDFSDPPAAPAGAARDEPIEAEHETRAEPEPVSEPGPEPESDQEPPGETGDEPEPEPEPEVVAVDVRRAPASPFRSTADMRPREMVEGTVAVPGAQFAAATLPATVGPGAAAGSAGAVSTFLDLVAQRVGVIQQTAPASVTEAVPQRLSPEEIDVESDDEPVIRILHIDVDDLPRAPARDARVRVPETRAPAPLGRAALPPAPRETMSARRAVVMALVVGLIIGFVLGLAVADLL